MRAGAAAIDGGRGFAPLGKAAGYTLRGGHRDMQSEPCWIASLELVGSLHGRLEGRRLWVRWR